MGVKEVLHCLKERKHAVGWATRWALPREMDGTLDGGFSFVFRSGSLNRASRSLGASRRHMLNDFTTG